jgi:hypothetical protein
MHNLVAKHRINVSWYGKSLYLCKYDPNVSSLKSPYEVCIKLDKYETEEEALEAGLEELLGEAYENTITTSPTPL